MIIITDQKVVLYSIGCPSCNVLKRKLDDAGINYEVNTSKEEMAALGFKSMPILQVGDQHMKFGDAIRWITDHKG